MPKAPPPSSQSTPVARVPQPARHKPCELLEKMRNSPAADWTMKDVETLCKQVGMTCKPPTRGTHHKVTATGIPFILTIPYNRPIKACYIRQLVQLAGRYRDQSGA